ncbi:ty3-gypsy retrotransposon protein [Tanacetum coccineum]
MAPLPAADQRHPWLRYQVKEYTEGIIHSYEQRLETICSRPVNRVYVLDFEGLTLGMRQALAVRLRMVYTREGKQFLSTCKMSDTEMGLDVADTLCFQLEGHAPSYVLIRDPVRRLCHKMIAYSISGRGQTPEKYLFRHAEGRKSRARLSRGHFIGRLAMHFGLVSDEGLRGLQVVTQEIPLIDLHELERLNICSRFGETWAWAPPPLPPAPQPQTMSQMIERIEEESVIYDMMFSWTPAAILIRHSIAPLSIAHGCPTRGVSDPGQRNKPNLEAYPGALQHLPIPNKVLPDVSMDFIDGLPSSHGKSVILVVVDRLTKYAYFIALSHPYTAVQVAQVFLDHVYKLHGMPATIDSDRDKVFLSLFWKSLFKSLKTKLHMSTTYHPQSDGQTKVVNRCLECFLRCMTGDKPKEWTQWLSLAEYWYNTNFYTAIQTTPYEALYGQSPTFHIPYIEGSSSVDLVDRTLLAREEAIKLLKFYLKRAQDRMKSQADKHRNDKEFEVGVWLKKCQSEDVHMGTFLVCTEQGVLAEEPLAVLDRRMRKKGNRAVVYLLIQ